MNQQITTRYANETETANLGCANLTSLYDIQEGDNILDLGCGKGTATRYLGGLTGESGFVHGLDLTKEMITKAKELNQLQNTSYQQGDIHKLPYQNDYFNSVVSNCVINHSPNKLQVFREIHRVLVNSGHFLIGDVMSVERLPEEISSNPDNIAACWGGAIPKADYVQIIEEIGFTNIEILSSRRYFKNGYELESIIIKGVKYEKNN